MSRSCPPKLHQKRPFGTDDANNVVRVRRRKGVRLARASNVVERFGKRSVGIRPSRLVNENRLALNLNSDKTKSQRDRTLPGQNNTICTIGHRTNIESSAGDLVTQCLRQSHGTVRRRKCNLPNRPPRRDRK